MELIKLSSRVLVQPSAVRKIADGVCVFDNGLSLEVSELDVQLIRESTLPRVVAESGEQAVYLELVSDDETGRDYLQPVVVPLLATLVGVQGTRPLLEHWPGRQASGASSEVGRLDREGRVTCYTSRIVYPSVEAFAQAITAKYFGRVDVGWRNSA